MFMQNGVYTTFWYRQLQLQFTIVYCFFFLVFFETTAEFGQPERSVSFVFVRPRLKSAYQLLIVVSDGAESE